MWHMLMHTITKGRSTVETKLKGASLMAERCSDPERISDDSDRSGVQTEHLNQCVPVTT